MQCSMCGREITNPNANYCDYCGTAVGAATYREVQPQQVSNTNAPKQDRVSTWLFFGHYVSAVRAVCGHYCVPGIPVLLGLCAEC